MSKKQIRDEVIDALDKTGKWGTTKTTPKVAERAGYKCEYCDLDLLESVMHYWLIEVDHIIPKSKFEGDPDRIDNLAFSCRTCNVNLKRAWDPRTVAGQNASRCELIEAARQHVADGKKRKQKELEDIHKIVGYPFDGYA